MRLHFYKYHGTGNDFIMIDDRAGQFPRMDYRLVANLCNRHKGIGADGLILIGDCKDADFEMCYYNADGKPGSLCGNGGRCAVAFASFIGIVSNHVKFKASDGLHEARLLNDNRVQLNMHDVHEMEYNPEFCVLNTGSPHYVAMHSDVSKLDVVKEGRKIRYHERFAAAGINVNFVELSSNTLTVRTYERGVENETLSCGTGVTAAAIAAAVTKSMLGHCHFHVVTLGGELEVSFTSNANHSFSHIQLTGPAIAVFEGMLDC